MFSVSVDLNSFYVIAVVSVVSTVESTFLELHPQMLVHTKNADNNAINFFIVSLLEVIFFNYIIAAIKIQCYKCYIVNILQ